MPHGALPAADVGALVGVSGTTIGQWARRGYIRSSVAGPEAGPRVYGVEDVAEASVVRELLHRGVRRADIVVAVRRLRAAGHTWPLSEARLATAGGGSAVTPRLLVGDDDGWLELGPRGWQRVAPLDPIAEVVPRLHARAGEGITAPGG